MDHATLRGGREKPVDTLSTPPLHLPDSVAVRQVSRKSGKGNPSFSPRQWEKDMYDVEITEREFFEAEEWAIKHNEPFVAYVYLCARYHYCPPFVRDVISQLRDRILYLLPYGADVSVLFQ